MRAANVRLALPVRSLATRSGRPIHGKKDGPTIMRARAGDPPRTMPQKILAGRASDPQLGSADGTKIFLSMMEATRATRATNGAERIKQVA